MWTVTENPSSSLEHEPSDNRPLPLQLSWERVLSRVLPAGPPCSRLPTTWDALFLGGGGEWVVLLLSHAGEDREQTRGGRNQGRVSGCRRLEALRARPYPPHGQGDRGVSPGEQAPGWRWLPDISTPRMGMGSSSCEAPLEGVGFSGHFGTDPSHCDESQ